MITIDDYGDDIDVIAYTRTYTFTDIYIIYIYTYIYTKWICFLIFDEKQQVLIWEILLRVQNKRDRNTYYGS